MDELTPAQWAELRADPLAMRDALRATRRYVRLAFANDAPDARLPPFEATPFDVRERGAAR